MARRPVGLIDAPKPPANEQDRVLRRRAGKPMQLPKAPIRFLLLKMQPMAKRDDIGDRWLAAHAWELFFKPIVGAPYVGNLNA
jgi:hypothetical protein